MTDNKNKYNPYNLDKNERTIMENKNLSTTYGELTLKGLKTIMKNINTKDKIFADLGSGAGNVIINAITYYPSLKAGIGIEFSTHRHKIALHNKQKIKNKEINKKIKFYNNDFLRKSFKNFDIIYISNLCFNDYLNSKLADKLNKELKPNSCVFSSKLLNLLNCKVTQIKVEQSWNNKSNLFKYQII